MNNLNIIIIAIFLLAVGLGCGQQNRINNAETAKSAKTDGTNKTDKTADETGAGVTIQNYKIVSMGMTKADVVKIFGETGEPLSENQIGKIKTEMFQWKAGFMATVHVTFQNDKVVSKSQFGLE